MPFEPRRERADVHVRDHPVRRDPPRTCRDVPRLRRPAAAPHRPRAHGDVRAQRDRRRRPAVRQGPRARRPLPRPGRGEEARFEADMEALNALPVASTPRASSAIPDIRGFIGMVLDRGLRLPGRRGGVLRRQQVRLVRLDRQLQHREDAGARPRPRRRRRQPGQAAPARLRAVAAIGTGRAVVGHAGAGPTGHTSSAAPSPCASSARRSTCTAAGPT